MHWVRVVRPSYQQSRRYDGQVGEVVGRFGPDNSTDGTEGYLVEFGDGEVVGVAEAEVEEVPGPALGPEAAQAPRS